MIITESKPKQEVLEELKNHEKILVLGCGRCATSCQTGGVKQVSEMVELLRGKGYQPAFDMVEAQCDERLSKKVLRGHEDFDCVLSMACGSGAAAVSDLVDAPVYPANNTLFLGVIKPKAEYEERCSMCGECMLSLTSGICPVTYCSKGLLHGPCGGSAEGRCEVDPLRECAWALIQKRLKKLNKKQNLIKIHQPRKTHQIHKPRRFKRK
ncbi:MAG: 5,10-methylenetetrahydrofolate reductase [Candidatus Altiarchaeales archaeon]|nr:5,10-methylenetetrahydrofolate reductase [Candidatus Altiarchaeales archaeon]